MALQQFARGFKTGMAPYLSQAFENKAADKDTERKLKYLKQLGAIQLKQKQLEEQMQFEDQLQRLSGVLKGVPGLPQQTPGLLAAGVEPSKIGMEMPLGQRGQNIFELEKMRLQEGIETEKARRAAEEAQQAYIGQMSQKAQQKDITDDPRFKQLSTWYKILQDDFERARGQLIKDPVTGEQYFEGGKPEEVQQIEKQLRWVQQEILKIFGEIPKEFFGEPSQQEQPLNMDALYSYMYPQYRYTRQPMMTQKETAGEAPTTMRGAISPTEGRGEPGMAGRIGESILKSIGSAGGGIWGSMFRGKEEPGITADPEFQKRVKLLMQKGMSREEAEQKILGLINQ